jgi:hypothetical protein
MVLADDSRVLRAFNTQNFFGYIEKKKIAREKRQEARVGKHSKVGHMISISGISIDTPFEKCTAIERKNKGLKLINTVN